MARPTARTLLIGLSIGLSTMEATVAAEFASRDEAVAMVRKAVAFVREQGESAAYAEFSRKGGRFHDRDLYITVLGIDGRVLAHGQRGDLIGQNLIDAKDPDGKPFIKERSELSLQRPSFWQNYKFMNPATRKVESKTCTASASVRRTSAEVYTGPNMTMAGGHAIPEERRLGPRRF